MRILHADTDDLGNPLRGGQPVRTFEINSRLASQHDITVLTATYPGCERQLERANIRYRRLGVTMSGLGLSSHLSFMASLGMAIRRMPHDLVVEEFTPPVGFGLLPWWTRKPVISIVQWFGFDAWQRRYRLPFEQIMKRVSATGRYQNFIVQTDAMATYFQKLLPSARIWTLGCGVDDAAFQPGWTQGSYVAFLGRLDVDQKGLDLLLEIWTHLQAGGHAIPLKIIGEGPSRAFLEREIGRRSLASCVELVGRAEGERKRALLRDAAFLAMPSRVETFGIVALEGMAASKPVIAFDIPNLNEVLRPDWAVLVPPSEIAQFARGVVELWGNPERRRHMSEHAYRAADHQRWDMLAPQQNAIYNEVVATSQGR